MVYFSKIQLNPTALEKKALRHPYAIHQLVWAMFLNSQEQKRDFIYRQEIVHDKTTFYIVSHRLPQDINQEWYIESKEYHPQLSVGDRLAFRLRVNPVKTIKGQNQKNKRVDLVYHYKKQLESSKPDANVLSVQSIIHLTSLDWLEKQGNTHGFRCFPDTITIQDNERFVFQRKKHKVTINTVDLQGILEVTNPQNLTERLVNGFGHGKAFGCGLMMVKRV